MAEFPALPLWTDSYLADTAHLSDAEHGLYLRFLMIMWRSPECRVPNDDAWLARRLGKDADAMRTHMRPLIDEFCQTDGNWITQKRLLKEWNWCRNKSAKASDSAKRRWEKEKHSSDGNATQHSVRNAPTPTPTPTPKEDIYSSEFEAFWSAYPRREGKKQAARAYQAARKKITHDQLMGLLRQCRFNPDPKFIPHAATWLNGERWADEPAKVNGGGYDSPFI